MNDIRERTYRLNRVLEITGVLPLCASHGTSKTFLSEIQNLDCVQKIDEAVEDRWSDDEIKINALHKFVLFFENGLEYSENAAVRMASILGLIKNDSDNAYLKIMAHSLIAKCIEVLDLFEKRIEFSKIKNIFVENSYRLKDLKILRYEDHAKTDLQKEIRDKKAISIYPYGRGEDIKFLIAYLKISTAMDGVRHGFDSSAMSKFDREGIGILWDLYELLEGEIYNFTDFFKNLNDVLGILDKHVGQKYLHLSLYSDIKNLSEKAYKDKNNMGHKDWSSIKKRLNPILVEHEKMI